MTVDWIEGDYGYSIVYTFLDGEGEPIPLGGFTPTIVTKLNNKLKRHIGTLYTDGADGKVLFLVPENLLLDSGKLQHQCSVEGTTNKYTSPIYEKEIGELLGSR